MNRRQFLKSLATAVAITAVPIRLVSAKELPIHFWMQTYGPHYDPSSFGFERSKVISSLLGIYHGEELLGMKAIDHPIGDRVVLPDGRRYMCYGPNASRLGIHIEGKGVFLNES